MRPSITNLSRRRVAATILLAFALATPLLAATKTEDQLIAELGASDPDKVTSALQELEEKYPTSTKALATIKKLLTDQRMRVKRKAARVIGAVHAEVNEDDIRAICALLKPPRMEERPDSVLKGPPVEAMLDGLKALRGLKAPSAIPEVTPLLRYSNNHVVRDACRTLAVIGNKDVIPAIEPLLEDSNREVRKDAKEAIAALRSKS